MQSIQELIDISKIPQITVDLKTFVKEYKEFLENDADFFGELTEYEPNNFESNQWKFFDEYALSFRTLDFDILKDLNSLYIVSAEDISLIKCYILDCYENGSATSSLPRILRSVSRVISITKNFNHEILHNETGNILNTLAYVEKDVISQHIVNYINFLGSIGLATDEHLFISAQLYSTPISINEINARVLPPTKDIMAFDFYIKNFFKTEKDKTLLNLYKPLLLWWKITNVIPMRPSEFTAKLNRDCASFEDENFYLHINRVKVTTSKRGSDPVIPILSKIEIIKDVYDLIQDYISCTSFDKECKSLLSYNAYRKFGGDSKKISIDRKKKEFTHRFTRQCLLQLIERFYRDIIQAKYNDCTNLTVLKPGDTRHLAFCSLMMQGVPPLEIAMLGGHTTLSAQEHYVGHATYFIESEILKFLSANTIQKDISFKSLKDIVFSKPIVPSTNLTRCFKTEDDIGYCTINVRDGEVCPQSKYCFFCEKWWCEPTNSSLLKIQKYLKDNAVTPLKEQLTQEEAFLHSLINKAKVVNVNSLLEIERFDNERIQQQSLKVRTTADEIIFYQKALLSSFSNNAKLI